MTTEKKTESPNHPIVAAVTPPQSSLGPAPAPVAHDLSPARPGILPAYDRAVKRATERTIKAELIAGADPRAIADASSTPFGKLRMIADKVGVNVERRIQLELKQAIATTNRAYKYLSRKSFKNISAVELSKMAFRHGSHVMRILENQQGFSRESWNPSPRTVLALRLITDTGHAEAQAIAGQEDTEAQG